VDLSDQIPALAVANQPRLKHPYFLWVLLYFPGWQEDRVEKKPGSRRPLSNHVDFA
jgi:hypothetical protein